MCGTCRMWRRAVRLGIRVSGMRSVSTGKRRSPRADGPPSAGPPLAGARQSERCGRGDFLLVPGKLERSLIVDGGWFCERALGAVCRFQLGVTEVVMALAHPSGR